MQDNPLLSQLGKDEVREKVRSRYAEIAKTECSCCSSPSASSLGNAEVSAKLGYSEEEMNAVPESSNMGLGCGNPQAIAALKAGEVVVDLGSGGGFDCFLAAARVGASGKVIGVDMTPEMISKARKNAVENKYENVEFRLGEIEYLPIPDNTADAIMSNCVINLSPDKPQVYREAWRILKPGGRIAISDVVAIKELPSEMKSSFGALSGCISGAETVPDIERILGAAGFRNIQIAVNEASGNFIKDWVPGSGAENYIRSSIITAIK